MMTLTYKVNSVKSKIDSEGKRKRSVLYISIVNQEFSKPVKELLSGFRHNNPFRDYRKYVLPVALKMLGLPADTKASWSQKAGCSCGCSPGFVLATLGQPKHMWADVEMNISGQMELSLS